MYVFISGLELCEQVVNVIFQVSILFPELLRFLLLLQVGIVQVGQDLKQFGKDSDGSGDIFAEISHPQEVLVPGVGELSEVILMGLSCFNEPGFDLIAHLSFFGSHKLFAPTKKINDLIH
jgi:hypothetical protein